MTLEEFKSKIENGISIAKFEASWCYPCKMLTKTLEAFSQKHPDINVVYIDVEESEEIAANFGVTSVPVMFFFVDGEPKERVVGNVPEAKIEQVVQGLLK